MDRKIVIICIINVIGVPIKIQFKFTLKNRLNVIKHKVKNIILKFTSDTFFREVHGFFHPQCNCRNSLVYRLYRLVLIR